MSACLDVHHRDWIFQKFAEGLSDARWKIVESSTDDIGVCSLAWRREVSGAMLSKAI